MENILVKSVCFGFNWNSIFIDFSETVTEFFSKNKTCIKSANGQRFSRISARQMLNSSILLRVYGERSAFLGFVFFMLIQGWFLPAFFVPICMSIRK